ncbi:MAG TPA: stage II sporulation protein M [Caulobacterales bacterium]|nr:stage II sporulation protein M [Caulobacterales bacterium]
MRVADDRLRSLRFRQEREESWKRLEALLKKAERGSTRGLSDEDMVAIPALYRAALSSLSVARSTSLDAALIEYLEALCARAYFFVYGARSTLMQRVGGFFARDWPLAVQRLWRETLASGFLMLAGVLVALFLVLNDSDWFSSFISDDLAQGRTPYASAESLRSALYGAVDKDSHLSFFATWLFTHNAGISLLSFALGFAFCLPTALLILQNGLMLGALSAVFISHGLGFQFYGWILIHGVTELFAITLAGAAGMRLGWSIAFPCALSRVAAAVHAGRQGGVVMLGVIIMLVVAGLLEGVGRQVITNDFARYAVAAATALLWGLYFYLPRRPGDG